MTTSLPAAWITISSPAIDATVASGCVTPTFADVQAAAVAIEGAVVRTPTVRSHTLSAITGAEIWLKLENLQFTSSFKERGALNRLLALSPEQRSRGVVAASAGNHAQGVAHHAARLGVPATIVMPWSTPSVKVVGTTTLGASVVMFGDDIAAAQESALELAAAEGLTWISPFDDALIIAGQGTAALEIFEDVPDLDALVVPVGGGGLIAGIALVASELARECEVIGVESELYPGMLVALRGGHVPGGVTLAEGIAVAQPGTLTLPIVRELVTDVVTVPESTIEHAVNLLLEIEKTVVEGAGAASLAAVLADPTRFAGRRIGLVVSGGNIDLRLLASVIMRGLVRSGRVSRLSVEVGDVPGALGRVATIAGEIGANIIEVAHQRLFADIDLKATVIELAVETRDLDHARMLIDAFRAAGYEVRS
jgi:threonine dehydratase